VRRRAVERKLLGWACLLHGKEELVIIISPLLKKLLNEILVTRSAEDGLTNLHAEF
jgi:hypothetical protein